MKSNPTRLTILGCAAALGLALWSVGIKATAEQKPTTHTVIMDASRYIPEVLTLKAGDTVLWINHDIVAHTATSSAAGFDSGSIEPGKSWKHTLTHAGEFAYSCTFHPTMKGTLQVK